MAICPKIDNCQKIKMVLDKDMAGDWQYAQAIREVCGKCGNNEAKTR